MSFWRLHCAGTRCSFPFFFTSLWHSHLSFNISSPYVCHYLHHRNRSPSIAPSTIYPFWLAAPSISFSPSRPSLMSLMRSMTKWCVLASVSRTKTAIRSTTLSVAASSTTRYSSRRSRIPSSILYTTMATPSTSPFLKKKDLEPSAPPSKFRAQRLSIVSPFNTIWYAKKLAIDSSRTKSRSSLFRIVSIRPTKRRRRCWEASILVFSIMETSCWVCWWILNRFTSCLLNSTSWSTCFRMQVNINVVISQSTLFLRIYHQSRLLTLKWFLRTCNRMWSRNTVTIRMN